MWGRTTRELLAELLLLLVLAAFVGVNEAFVSTKSRVQYGFRRAEVGVESYVLCPVDGVTCAVSCLLIDLPLRW